MYVLQDVQCISGLRIVVFYVTDVFAVPGWIFINIEL